MNDKRDLLFNFFILWTFILIGRPQDIFLPIAAIRPALLIMVVTIFYLLLAKSKLIILNFPKKSLPRLYLYLIVVMVLGIPFAYHRKVAFLFFFTQYISTVLYFFVFYFTIQDIYRLKKVLFTCSLAAGMYALFSLLSGAAVAGRLQFSHMYDPNDLSYFLVTFLPLYFLFLTRDNRLLVRGISFAALLICTVVILMTGSRGGFLGLIGILVIWFFRSKFNLNFKHRIIFAVFACIIIVANVEHIDFERFRSIIDYKKDYNLVDEFGRKELWKIGLHLFAERPITGVGLSCFNMAVGFYRQKAGILPKWQTAHNSIVEIGTETGIIGLYLYILINLKIFYHLFRKLKRPVSREYERIRELVKLSFIGSFISSMFLSQAYSALWVFFIATTAVLANMKKDIVKSNDKS